MNISLRYIAVVLGLTILLAYLEFLFPEKGVTTVYMISPAVVALGFGMLDRNRHWRNFGWAPNFSYWRVICAWISMLVFLLLMIAWVSGHVEMNEKAVNKFLRVSTFVGLGVGILMNSGEEIGWRGYMLPKLLEQYGWWTTIGISTLVWWLWHVPIMAVLQIRQFGEVQIYTQLVQLVAMLPATILLSIWFLESKSVFAIGFAHQLANFSNKWFLGLEHSAKTPIFFANKDHTYLYSTENGVIGTTLAYGVAGLAYFLYRKRSHR